jgi:hypothetical protein
MNKIIVTIISLLLSTSIFAESPLSCIDKLMDGHVDSVSYTLNQDNYELRDFGPDHLAHAIQLIRLQIGNVGCKRVDINFKRTGLGRNARSKCTFIYPGELSSLACYVETNIGFFKVDYNMQTNAHISFNRWD